MALSILTVITFVVEVILVLSFVAILFTNVYYYSIGIFALVLLVFLINSSFFYISSRKALNVKNEDYYSFLKFYRKNLDEFIVYIYEDCWVMQIKENSITFHFNKYYLFKKSFVRAYVIRNLRYKMISKKRPINELMNFRFNLGNNENIRIVFIEDDKKTVANVCKNGVVKNTVFSREITKSHFYGFYLSNVNYNKYMKRVIYIDEKVYDRFV